MSQWTRRMSTTQALQNAMYRLWLSAVGNDRDENADDYARELRAGIAAGVEPSWSAAGKKRFTEWCESSASVLLAVVVLLLCAGSASAQDAPPASCLRWPAALFESQPGPQVPAIFEPFAKVTPDHDGWPLHVALGYMLAASGGDAWVTGVVQGSGCGVEANPILGFSDLHPALAGVFKLGMNAAVGYALLKIHAKHPKIATWLAGGSGGIFTWAMVHNSNILQRCRGHQ